MTRINSGIHPKELIDQHLVAEYREIGRIGTLLENKIKKSFPLNIPDKFCLGTGHMSFFLNKGKFIENRFEQIKIEMAKRGYSTNLNFRNSWLKCNRLDLYNDYSPTEEAVNQLKERIKIRTPKNARYYGRHTKYV